MTPEQNIRDVLTRTLAITRSEEIKNIFMVAMLHGASYRGPQLTPQEVDSALLSLDNLEKRLK